MSIFPRCSPTFAPALQTYILPILTHPTFSLSTFYNPSQAFPPSVPDPGCSLWRPSAGSERVVPSSASLSRQASRRMRWLFSERTGSCSLSALAPGLPAAAARGGAALLQKTAHVQGERQLHCLLFPQGLQLPHLGRGSRSSPSQRPLPVRLGRREGGMIEAARLAAPPCPSPPAHAQSFFLASWEAGDQALGPGTASSLPPLAGTPSFLTSGSVPPAAAAAAGFGGSVQDIAASVAQQSC